MSRDREIKRRWIDGETQNSLAKEFGLTRQRVSQICGPTPLVRAAPVNAAVEATGTPRRELAERFADRFGVAVTTAHTFFNEMRWRPWMRLNSADRVLTLIDRTDVLDALDPDLSTQRISQ